MAQQEVQCVIEQQQNVVRVTQDPEEDTDDNDSRSTIVVSPLRPMRKRNRAITSAVGSSIPTPSSRMCLRSRNQVVVV